MREAQRARTRKAIVRAAGRLVQRGLRPSLEDIAAEAEVSRATAYRYFPGLDALLSEATVDAMVPEPDELFPAGAPDDPLTRVELVDAAFDRACREQEMPLRLMLARTLERSVQPNGADGPLRQNRRVPALERALAPAPLDQRRKRLLVRALAMVIGTEGMIALKDVVGLNDAEARDVRRWAIGALLAAAMPADSPLASPQPQ